MTYLWLHLASRFLALAALLGAFSIAFRVYHWYRKGTKKQSDYSKLIAEASDESWSHRSNPTHMTITDYWPVLFVAISSFLLGGYMQSLRHEFRQQQFDEMQDVTIIQRSDPYTFRMRVDDPDTHKPREFGVRFCPDYEPTHEMQPGVKLTYLKFQRHDLDNCWEIAPENLGYGLWRDNANKPIIFGER